MERLQNMKRRDLLMAVPALIALPHIIGPKDKKAEVDHNSNIYTDKFVDSAIEQADVYNIPEIVWWNHTESCNCNNGSGYSCIRGGYCSTVHCGNNSELERSNCSVCNPALTFGKPLARRALKVYICIGCRILLVSTDGIYQGYFNQCNSCDTIISNVSLAEVIKPKCRNKKCNKEFRYLKSHSLAKKGVSVDYSGDYNGFQCGCYMCSVQKEGHSCLAEDYTYTRGGKADAQVYINGKPVANVKKINVEYSEHQNDGHYCTLGGTTEMGAKQKELTFTYSADTKGYLEAWRKAKQKVVERLN